MKYAVLIDFDYAKANLDDIFLEISKYGDTPIRYLIGDFITKSQMDLISILQKYAIKPIQTLNYGKNRDISFAVEGMKILYEKPYIDGFVVISSNNELLPLLRQFRLMGKDVIGFGKRDISDSYKASCNKFIYIDNIYKKNNVSESLINNENKTKNNSKPKRQKITKKSKPRVKKVNVRREEIEDKIDL